MTARGILAHLVALALAAALPACGGPDPGTGDTGAGGLDAGPVDAGPCATDLDCPGSYCNPGSRACCVPAVPPYEICGDRIDQNCDRRDESCGDNDGDGIQACMPGQDPLGGCDCDDESAAVRPPLGTVPGAEEICDGVDNDCNGRIDESARCCEGCASLGAERDRADICLLDGTCDCSTDPATGPCAAGLRCCRSGCADVRTDIENCGFCNAPCTNQADTCAAGACACGANPPCDLNAECTAGVCAMM